MGQENIRRARGLYRYAQWYSQPRVSQNAVDAQKTSFVSLWEWPGEHHMPDLVRHLKGAFQPANGAERPDQVTRGFIAQVAPKVGEAGCDTEICRRVLPILFPNA